MTTRVKRIIAAMLSTAILTNSSILFASAEENVINLKMDNEEFFTSPESNSSCPCMNDNYFEPIAEEEIVDLESLEQNSITSYSIENETMAYEGQCGENATYHFDTDTGTLTISGTGDMYSYNYDDTKPWDSFRNKVKTLIFKNGVTSIGSHSFMRMDNLTDVQMCETLNIIEDYAFAGDENLISIRVTAKNIGQLAFVYCNELTEITITDNVEIISSRAFYDTKINAITIPSSVYKISNGAFENMNELKSIKVSKNNMYYSNDEYGILYNKDKTELIFIPSELHWENNDTDLKYTDLSGNNYLIVNNCIYDFKVSEYSNGIFNTEYELTNSEGKSADIKAVRLIEGKEYPDIYNIVVGRDVELYPNTFDKTYWYKSNQNNAAVIYETLSPTSSTYSRLYKYNLNTYSVNLSDYSYIEADALKNNNGNEIVLNISSISLPKINDLAFRYANISSIKIDNKELSYEYFLFSSDELVIAGGVKGAGFFVNEDSFKVQLAYAVSNSEDYRNLLEDEYCYDLIKVNHWDKMAEEDPYEAYYSIYMWVKKNRPYMGWWKECDVFNSPINNYNGIGYYDYGQVISGSTFGGMMTGYNICGGHARTVADIIKKLNNKNIACEVLYSSTHGWDIVGIKSDTENEMMWYYSDIEYSNYFLIGQNNFGDKNGAYDGYRKEYITTTTFKNNITSLEINYSYIDDNGNEVIINEQGNKGRLSADNHSYIRNQMDFCVQEIINNSNYQVDISISYPDEDKVSVLKYKNKKVRHGYTLLTDNMSDDAFDNLTVNIELRDDAGNIILSQSEDFSEAMKHSNNVYGTAYQLNNDEKLYMYGIYKNGNVSLVVSDRDQLKLCTKMHYRIYDTAGLDNISIRTENGGEYCNLPRTEKRDGLGNLMAYENMTDYAEITQYTDFSGYVSLAGVDVFDFDDPDVGTYYGTTAVTEFGIKKIVGYYITVTQDSETKEKYIDIKTYQSGDLNLNGVIDTEDVTLLSRYLVKGYQFIQTGSDGDLTFNASNITVNGDIAANGTMNILGGIAHINGTLTARHLNDAAGGSNLTYKKVGEDEEAFPIDIITDTFSDENMMKWYFSKEDMTVYDFTELTDSGTAIYGMGIYPEIDMEEIKDTYSKNGALMFHGGFNVTGNIKATYGIYVDNAEQFKISSVAYSEKGDINITADKVTINGFIYAPNGKVTITSNDLNITGTIVAKELEIVSNGNLNFNVAALDITGVAQLSEFQLMLADVNGDGKINILDDILLKRKLIY